MILLETSVLVDHFRSKGRDPKLAGLFATLPLQMCGPVRSEAVSGALNPADRVRIVNFLDSLPQLAVPDSAWDDLGDHLAVLRRAGISVPYPDTLIATLAIHLRIELWTRDKHFTLMRTVLPALRLFAEPP